MNLKEFNEIVPEKNMEISNIKDEIMALKNMLERPEESQLKPITIDDIKVGNYVWFNSYDVEMFLIHVDSIDKNNGLIYSGNYVYNIENLFVEKLNQSEIELQLKNIVKHSVGCKYCKHKKLLPTNKICCECGIEYKNWDFEYNE